MNYFSQFFHKTLPLKSKGVLRNDSGVGRDFESAFTLIELIIGITISMLLMVSVWVFVSGGMQNIFLQQKVFENAGDFVSFNTSFLSSLDSLDSNTSPTIISDALLFKSQPYFANGGFSYIWTGASESWYYCSGSELPIGGDVTQHLFIKNFIPHFEDGENDISQVLTGSVSGYTSHVKKHIITNTSWDIVVWKETFWTTLWTVWTGTFLNSPTGLAFHNNILFISDTLNNRILAYDTTDDSIELLLDETDGLDEPTWLAMSGSSLLIANSWVGEILEYSSRVYSNYPAATFSFTGETVSSFNFTPYLSSTIVDIWLSQTSFTNLNTTQNFYEDNEYLFVNYGSIWNQGVCWAAGKIYNWWNPINCTNSGSGRTSSPTNQSNFNEININQWWSISATWSYYVHLELSTGTQHYFPYFTQWDDDLLTKDDNTLTVLESGLEYPNYISWSNIPADVSTFSGATYTGDIDFDPTYDTILKTPINEFNIDMSSNLLTLTGSYYKNYDCYNEDVRVTREFIWKKNLD